MSEGEIIAGRYRVGEELGRGAFARTYAGERLIDGQAVAIKALDLGRVDDWKAVELFEREAKVLAGLDHPQIPDYVEFIPLAEDRRGYLVQELAPGRSLAAGLEAGRRFDREQLRDIARQLLEILIYLGELLPPVVHRDIKPANILRDEAGRCYLVDFGSVRDAVGARSGGSTVAGTFGYMAPEQLHGEAGPSSDLYGLGMTLIHLATGREPSSLPRRRLVVDFRGEVSVDEDFAVFLDGLIQPAPEDRFASPRAALAALRGSGRALAKRAPEGRPARPEEIERLRRAVEAYGGGRTPGLPGLPGLLRLLGPRASEPPSIEARTDARGVVVEFAPPPLRVDVRYSVFVGAVIGGFLGGPVGAFVLEFLEGSMAMAALAVAGTIALSIGGTLIKQLRERKGRCLRVGEGRYSLWSGDAARPERSGAASALRIEVQETPFGGALVRIGASGWTERVAVTRPGELEAIEAVIDQLEGSQVRMLPAKR